MTEDEAKTKTCCGPAPHNTGQPLADDGGYITYLCAGSACMAWRDTSRTETIYTEPTSASPGVRHEKRPGGYCGLAGMPESMHLRST